MPVTFQDIVTDVSADLNQGTSVDDIILTKLYSAHRTLEANNDFAYMDVVNSQVIPAGDLSFTLASGRRTKRVHAFRYEYETRFNYLEQVHPEDASKVETAPPKYYLRVGVDTINLFLGFTEDTTLTIFQSELSNVYIPTGETWLTEVGRDLLHYMAIGGMSVPLHDPALMQLAAPMIETNLKTLLILDDEIKASNVNSVMRYG